MKELNYRELLKDQAQKVKITIEMDAVFVSFQETQNGNELGFVYDAECLNGFPKQRAMLRITEKELINMKIQRWDVVKE